MPDHPPDVRAGEHCLSRLSLEDVPHRSLQSNRVAPRVALHAFWRPRRPRGVEDVARFRGFHPLDRDLFPRMAFAQLRVVQVSPFGEGQVLRYAPVQDNDLLWWELG